jgi:thiol-disulfide isomerase/thioredoxin
VRAPVDHIAAPPFPPKLPWVNVAMLRMDQQLGRPVLLEFWDFCRPNSIRTLPYMTEWHARYAEAGLRVIGIHTSGFAPSKDPDAVRSAVERLEIRYPVVVDVEYEIWKLYGNLGWPARYVFNRQGMLADYHYGEGGYGDTEHLIQELLSTPRDTVEPLRPEDAPGVQLKRQSDDVEGAYNGRYEAGGVWAVLDGDGEVTANGRRTTVDHPGCYELIAHPRSTAGELELQVGDGVECYATCVTPGLA